MIRERFDLTMIDQKNAEISRTRELIILEACRGLADELKLVDVADYVCLLHTANLVTLEDLVSSSIEPFFRPEAVSFAYAGDYRVSWSQPPVICLDFEFLHEGVFAFFRILLKSSGPDVEINHLSFEQAGNAPSANTELLRQAFRSASLA